MSLIRAAGVLVFRGNPIESFLLMKHRDRWDLPKGHQDEGESDLQCALREMREETGITAADVELISGFQWRTNYHVRSKRHGGKLMEKTVVIYLARLLNNVEIQLTEHQSYAWFPWQPPHQIQTATIDSLLAAVAEYWAARSL
jgi:8-oxo-dGTP pyrophosphatase MutT (NUDIX family)